MAEPVVSLVVDKLGESLIQEVAFLRGVRNQVQTLQTEFKRMQCFLKDADSKQEEDERVRNWVAEIRDIAYDAEDVIDSFIYKVASTRMSRGYHGVLKKCAFISKKPILLHRVGMEIQEIQGRISNIRNSRETYGIKKLGEGDEGLNEKLRQVRRSYPHYEDQLIIGLEEEVKKLIAELIKEEQHHRVVAIVGMGGSGKTTLAKKVYNHDAVKSHFDCSCWAFISQQCRTGDVLREILRKANSSLKLEDIERMKEQVLVEKLDECLKERRYLVVLDDIWDTHTWQCLQHAFPNGKSGSKIMVTTRNKEVALYMDAHSFIHEPRCFTKVESWSLICKKAFPEAILGTSSTPSSSSSSSAPPPLNNLELEEGFKRLGLQMVKKCGYLPLAVSVLAGVLATKKSLNEWERVNNKLSFYLSKDDDVLGKLALSYYDLPVNLKPCFLYLGLFPEDFKISQEKLIQLWIAEGFITQTEESEGETMEDVGYDYLVELINRGMVQLDGMDIHGKIVQCRLHDLMRDLCISKGREENFLENFSAQDSYEQIKDTFDEPSVDFTLTVPLTKARRHGRCVLLTEEKFRAWNCCIRYVSPGKHLRSLLFFGIELACWFKLDYEDFKLLRVLDLGAIPIKTNFLQNLGNLIHLRYLDINTCVTELSPSIGNLQRLQTLKLLNIASRGENFVRLPNVIWKMKDLRHLYLTGIGVSDGEELRIDTLSSLQTLQLRIVGDVSIGDNTLNNLKTLRFETRFTKNLELKYDGLGLVTRLSRCTHLLELDLNGTFGVGILAKIPYLEFFPPSLSVLTLANSCLKQDPMPALGKLPNLKELHLRSKSYIGKKLVCLANGFPQLLLLDLESCDFEEWIVEEGAMSSLKRIEIFRCEDLRMLPEGLKFITTLRELVIRDWRTEFKERLQEERGEDFYKIRYIPSISISSP